MPSGYRKLLVFIVTVLVTSGVFIFLLSAMRPENKVPDKSWPSKRELRRTLWRTKKLLVIYATGQKQATQTYSTFARNIAKNNDWLATSSMPDTAVGKRDLSLTPLLLIGSDFRGETVGQLLANLPGDFWGTGNLFGGKYETTAQDVFMLSQYPNPLNHNMPLSVISGRDEKAVVAHIKSTTDLFSSSGEFRVFRNGQSAVLAFFEQENHGPWTIDPDKIRFYSQEPQSTIETSHYVFIYHGTSIEPAVLKEIAERQQHRLNKMLRQLGEAVPVAQEPFPKIRYHIYESVEDKGLQTGNTDISHFDEQRWAVYALFNDSFDGTDFYSDAGLVLTKFLPRISSLALRDGLAMTFTDGWRRHDYKFWARRFFDTGNVNSLDELLNNEIYQRESYLFMRVQAGAFVDFLIEKVGLKKVCDLSSNWPTKGLPTMSENWTLPTLESSWLSYLKTLPAVAPVLRKPHKPVFQKGFSYAHEGYRIYDGYASQKGFESLTKLKALGTDWISIMPFGYLRNRNQPGYFYFSFGAGAENDEAIVTALQQAHQLGMKALLKPHVLMSGGNFGWPGEVEMKNPNDWQTFFDYYNKWIRHYAVIAEMYGFDSFCVGTELLHSTTKAYQDQWRKIIRNVRSLYSGPLVYAANWWQEFEQIEFWDELDYIGMNCYHPLSDKEDADMDELRRGVDQIIPIFAATAKKYGKPILLTEIGFTSTRQSWKEPHEDGYGSVAYMDDQVKCYRAVFECLKDKPWFYGFYWWKWPTYLDRGGPRHSSFTPNGKPTERVLAQWYGRTWHR